MKIVLATPLYPPDIAPPAQYVKELAKRLSAAHEVTLVVYGRLPEEVPGVRSVAVDKRLPLPLRLISYFFALAHAARGADVVYLQNGPSVELPATLLAPFLRAQLYFHYGDGAAHHYAQKHFWRRTIEGFVARRAGLIDDTPGQKPEILPLEAPPTAALALWEEAWKRHTTMLEQHFAHVS